MGKKIRNKRAILNKLMKTRSKMEVVKPTDPLLEKKTLHSVFTFIFNKVLVNQFYPEEFAQAHMALTTVKGMIESLDKEIKELEPIKPEKKKLDEQAKEPVQPAAESN